KNAPSFPYYQQPQKPSRLPESFDSPAVALPSFEPDAPESPKPEVSIPSPAPTKSSDIPESVQSSPSTQTPQPFTPMPVHIPYQPQLVYAPQQIPMQVQPVPYTSGQGAAAFPAGYIVQPAPYGTGMYIV